MAELWCNSRFWFTDSFHTHLPFYPYVVFIIQGSIMYDSWFQDDGHLGIFCLVSSYLDLIQMKWASVLEIKLLRELRTQMINRMASQMVCTGRLN